MKRQDKPRVYSYIRFSTPEQSMGDSERRQVEGAVGFAKRRNLPLDDTLALTDRGLSGYHGTHRTKGALGRFLLEVEAGSVPPKSILLVENIDRLSREGAFTIIRKIVGSLWDHEITLATLSPEEELYEPGCDNDPKFLALFLFMQRAQDESKRKSERVSAARDTARIAARESNALLTGRVPAWLDKDHAKATGERVVLPGAAEAINSIFKMKLDGCGLQTIVRHLNDNSTWTRKNGFRDSYVSKILSNRAVIGEYQPHVVRDGKRRPEGEVIEGYYPEIVKPELFHAVQDMMKKNKGKGGQTGKVKNLLTHLVKCAYCGGSMAFVDKGKDWQYLVCDNGIRKHKCERHSVRYDETIDTVLKNCVKLDPTKILPGDDVVAEKCQQLRQRICGLQAQVADNEEQIDNLIAQIGRSNSDAIAARCERRADDLEQKNKELLKAISKNENELRESEKGMESLKTWKRDLETLTTAIENDDAAVLRMKLKAHLRQFIKKVEIFATGRPDDDYYEKLESIALDFFPDALDDTCFLEFMQHMADRRQTKQGRFLRIHTKGGGEFDVVPDGSLASGMQLERDGNGRIGWRFVSPEWQLEYQDWKKKRNVKQPELAESPTTS